MTVGELKKLLNLFDESSDMEIKIQGIMGLSTILEIKVDTTKNPGIMWISLQ